MRFGIDFGTTHTVVALVDRGNYPIVSFEHGDAIPSVISAREGELRFGVAEHGAQTREEIAERADVPVTTVRRMVEKLVELGEVRELDQRGSARVFAVAA